MNFKTISSLFLSVQLEKKLIFFTFSHLIGLPVAFRMTVGGMCKYFTDTVFKFPMPIPCCVFLNNHHWINWTAGIIEQQKKMNVFYSLESLSKKILHTLD